MAGQSAVEDIRDMLRREIVERMQVGDLLPNERELAERFGVARNTVRETMIHLEAFGLIEKTRRGARVRQPDFDPIFSIFAQYFDHSPKTLADVLNFRRIVETGAAPLAVQGASEATLARMADANARMVRALTVSDAAAHDYDFHMAMIEATGNSVLIRMYRVLSVPLKFYLEVGKSRSPETEESNAQHMRIIEALRARDRAGLMAALNAHFDHSGAVLASACARIEGLGHAEPDPREETP
ncbi:FCD domain-containing protein [Cereibacter azotoformans]|uniref:GntR family transcriptional regulator n=2 Tax=Cereibacter TaxID=1653176 RepID=A0A2T5K9W3_9RHOB|nr:FCD domain-containing protein [Cereibacter azotoformans]AXQ95359.1 FadR family transcriptional regulator [Cereibacter sphaeroides]PTR19203.1 GntR family transcriptional regulator [Cereibacter azotoformans]UIJ32412.1 FCD domain-containing protein [Cereibacter azotoformans]ULB11675.1 FCD domain-containing protein [Cereibacter azotoformans]